MHAALALALLTLPAIGSAGTPVVPADWATGSPAPAPPGRQAIKAAVRETLAQEAAAASPGMDTLRGERADKFADRFAAAQVPGCLGPEALRHQPARMGPVALVGLFAAPFVLVAALRGKCN